MGKAGRMFGAALLLGLAAGATPTRAETPVNLAPGARVRATVVERSGGRADLRRLEGTLVAWGDSTFTLQTSRGGAPRVIPRADLDRLQIRTRPGRRGRGAAIGLGVGAFVGALAGYSSGDDPDGFVSFSAEAKAGMGAILLAPVGAIIGLAVAPGAEWETVAGARPTLGVTACGGGRSGVFLVARF